MSDGSLPSPALAGSRTASAASLSRVAEWTLPVAFCLLFLGVSHQPRMTVGGATISLSDLGVLAAAIAAAAALPAHAGRLRGSRWIWVTTVAFLAFIVAASLYPAASDSAYAWKTHLVTAAKYVEYAVLAPAVVLLVRDARALTRLLGTAAVWALLAGIVATLQYVGVDILGAWPSGWRQPSFVGISELGTLGGAALALGFVGLLRPGTVERRLGLAALVGGTLCVVLSGGIADQLGVVLAAVGAVLLVSLEDGVHWRRAALVGAITVVCGLGVLGLRHGDLTQYARYVGLAKADKSTNSDTQTFAQRELMYYLGIRVWLDKPILGAGWQSIREQQVYAPFLADAHRRYSNQPEQAFPHAADPDRQYGIDNAYIQALAELGAVGFLLFLALLGSGLVHGAKRALRAPPDAALRALAGVLWLLVAMGTWAGQGLVAGASFAALSWFALGLVASGGSREHANV